MRSGRIVRASKMVLLMAAGFSLCSVLVMVLWNLLMPEIFGLPRIRFVQALWIFILSKILFGGFRGGWGHRGHWRRRMMERWEHMTPEEREKFRKGMLGRCGRAPDPDRGGVARGGAAQAPEAQL